MNKKLFLKVKDLCKDTGVSEKYLKAITEKMGGSVEDDSTDEEAIETTANLIADIAKETQSEATRWANKKTPKTEEEKEEKTGSEEKEEKKDDPNAKKIADLEKELAEMKAAQSKGARTAAIATAMEKHKIPAKFRDRLAKSISDEEDIDAAVAAMKQDFITDGLMTDETEGSKGASEKQVDEAADNLLESITVK